MAETGHPASSRFPPAPDSVLLCSAVSRGIVGACLYGAVIGPDRSWKAMMVMLAAHSANGDGVRHPLDAYMRGTAALAREFAEDFGAGDLAAYLGLVHDVGKADCAWQERLAAVEAAGGRVGIDHKMAGTWLASRPAGVFSAAVNGHHGGLPARAALKNELRAADAGRQAAWVEAIERVAAVAPEVIPAAPLQLPSWFIGENPRDPLVMDLLVRIVFSALVDADFLD